MMSQIVESRADAGAVLRCRPAAWWIRATRTEPSAGRFGRQLDAQLPAVRGRQPLPDSGERGGVLAQRDGRAMHHLSYLNLADGPGSAGRLDVEFNRWAGESERGNCARGTPSGAVSVYVTDATHVILDIDGYFAPPAQNGLQFYPLPPAAY